MKFMNNHYGQSQIFERDGEQIPMNLQLFAEGSGDGGTAEGGESAIDDSGEGIANDEEDDSHTPNELAKQLAETKAELARLKFANDKSAKEAAAYKKQLQAKMSAEERASEAENERITALEEENKQMKAQMRIASYSKRYMGIGMDEKTAESLSELTGELADADKFFSALGKFITASNKAAEENYRQELIKNNPDINAGSGGDTKNSLAEERAVSIGKRTAGANEDILKFYRR